MAASRKKRSVSITKLRGPTGSGKVILSGRHACTLYFECVVRYGTQYLFVLSAVSHSLGTFRRLALGRLGVWYRLHLQITPGPAWVVTHKTITTLRVGKVLQHPRVASPRLLQALSKRHAWKTLQLPALERPTNPTWYGDSADLASCDRSITAQAVIGQVPQPQPGSQVSLQRETCLRPPFLHVAVRRCPSPNGPRTMNYEAFMSQHDLFMIVSGSKASISKLHRPCRTWQASSSLASFTVDTIRQRHQQRCNLRLD